MPTIEIEEELIAEITNAAKNVNKSPSDFLNSTLRKIFKPSKSKASDEEKVKAYIESYKKFPQTIEESTEWEDEQVWEDD
jgi:negative regulator of replication initiation